MHVFKRSPDLEVPFFSLLCALLPVFTAQNRKLNKSSQFMGVGRMQAHYALTKIFVFTFRLNVTVVFV